MVGLVEVRGRIGDRETGIIIGERGGVEKGFRVVREEGGGGGEGERRGGWPHARRDCLGPQGAADGLGGAVCERRVVGVVLAPRRRGRERERGRGRTHARRNCFSPEGALTY